jgi:7-cyano-7-deazaguanine tRNA-ribosyltransferase
MVVPSTDGTSLAHTPGDFDLREYDYAPDPDKPLCLILPCSDTKPYSNSRTHTEVVDRLQEAGFWESIQKVSVSGLYGPVPQEYERHDAVLTYDYLLNDVDEAQIGLVHDRLVEFLEEHGGDFHQVIGYVTSKTYRTTIGDAFEEAGVGTLLPRDPAARRFTEHFANENLTELVDTVEQSLETANTLRA